MSIDGIHKGGMPPPPLGLDGSTPKTSAAGAPPGVANELDSATLLGINDRLKGLQGGTGSQGAGGLPAPGELDKDLAARAASRHGFLTSEQVNADIYSFMALFAKLAQSMRDTARTQRTAEMQAQVTALQGAANQMREAAASRFTAAIVQGSMQIAGGLAQIGMSAGSMNSALKSAKLGQQGQGMIDAAKMGKMDIGPEKMGANQMAQLKSAGQALNRESMVQSQRSSMLQNTAQATGGIAGGIGGIAGAFFTKDADLADAKKAELEAQAKVHDTGVQHANDMMQQMMDVIRDVRDKMQSIQQASVETNRGIARNI